MPEDMSSPEGRYRALRALLEWRHPEGYPGMSVAQRAAVVRDTHGMLHVRVSQFAAHVRAIAGKPVPWEALHSRMSEVGWLYPRELQQRQPRGDGKVKLHLYRVPPAWDDGGEEGS